MHQHSGTLSQKWNRQFTRPIFPPDAKNTVWEGDYRPTGSRHTLLTWLGHVLKTNCTFTQLTYAMIQSWPVSFRVGSDGVKNVIIAFTVHVHSRQTRSRARLRVLQSGSNSQIGEVWQGKSFRTPALISHSCGERLGTRLPLIVTILPVISGMTSHSESVWNRDLTVGSP